LIPTYAQSLTSSQLGNKDGLHFLGPIRGVLPIGPNGVPAFNSLQPSPLDQTSGMISYNYTLDHQGLASNISCSYDPQSHIAVQAVAPGETLMLSYNGTQACNENGLTDFLPSQNVPQFTAPNTNNTLMFWSCISVPTGEEQPTYYVYLQGRVDYAAAIGNITCAISPIQPSVFPVTYQSGPGIFSAKNQTAANGPAIPGFIEIALLALGAVVQESQNVADNEVAESVFTFGVKGFNLTDTAPNDQYLRLYEAMIQGIIEYEVCLAN
jgi:hypothetical protein